jgi:hypothetical protein
MQKKQQHDISTPKTSYKIHFSIQSFVFTDSRTSIKVVNGFSQIRGDCTFNCKPKQRRKCHIKELLCEHLKCATVNFDITLYLPFASVMADNPDVFTA